MNELLSLLSAAVSYAMESPQNFVVVCGFVGWVGLFVQPLPKRTYAKPTPRKGRKQKAATNRKNRAVQPVKKAKAKKETAKKTEWTKPPIYTPADIFRIEEMFRRGRGENKFDNWAGV